MTKQVSRQIVVDALRSHIAERRQKIAMIVGKAMRDLPEADDSDFIEGLRELSKQPDIDSRGEISQFRTSGLRRRAGPSLSGKDWPEAGSNYR